MGTRPEHKFPFKVMVWIGVTFSGLTQVVILPQKTTFDSDFLTIQARAGFSWPGPARAHSARLARRSTGPQAITTKDLGTIIHILELDQLLIPDLNFKYKIWPLD